MKRRRNRKISEELLHKKLGDLKNLEHVLVLQKGSGLKLYSQSFCSHELYSELMSGLLEAISLMGERISGEKLRRLSYENYQVLIFEGKKTKGVCVLKDIPTSNFLVDALTVFIKKFEGRFAGSLMEFDGNLNTFDSTVEILDEAFSTYLIYPVSLIWDGDDESLSKLECNVLKITKDHCKKIELFTIPDLISILQNKLKKSEMELINVINNLLDRGYFLPSTCT